MPFQLRRDPASNSLVADPGAAITIFAESDSGTARIVAANLNGQPLAVDADGHITFTAAEGPMNLSLAFVSANPEEDLRLKEDGGQGTSEVLDTFRLSESPVRAYQINTFQLSGPKTCALGHPIIQGQQACAFGHPPKA